MRADLITYTTYWRRRITFLGIPQPPAFLDTPGEPTMLYTSWIKMFENYLVAIIADEEKTRTIAGLKGDIL